MSGAERLRPAPLRPGDQVAIVAPASPVRFPDRLSAGLDLLTSWGLEPVRMPSLSATHGFLAGTDESRLADLHAAWVDPDIRGIVCARGGYGCQRLADALDMEAVRADPKVFVGFSDATALHLALGRRAGLVTFHGPTAEWNPDRTGETAAASLRRALTDPTPLGALSGPALRSLHAGQASGPLVGGNLSMVSASVGTPDEPDTTGALLLLEDVGERPYRVDRMLRHLRRAGLVDRAAGLVFGEFVDCEETRPGRGSHSLEAVLTEFAAEVAAPAVAGLPIGHGRGQLTVPLGVATELDGTTATVTLVEPATQPGPGWPAGGDPRPAGASATRRGSAGPPPPDG